MTSTSDLKVGVRGQVLSLPRVFSVAASTSRRRCDAGSCQYYLQLSSSNLFSKSNVCNFDAISEVLLSVLLFDEKCLHYSWSQVSETREHAVVILDLCNRMFDCAAVNLSFIKRENESFVLCRAPLRPHRKHGSQPCRLSLQLKQTDTLILPMLHIILFMLLFLISGGGLTTVFSCYGDVTIRDGRERHSRNCGKKKTSCTC